MGLKLRDVQGLGGFDLFMQIEKSLGKLQGSLRDEVSSELFGARIGKAMAGASTDIEAAIEVARKFNSVISTDQNAALDDAGERFERWMRNFKTETASAFGQLIINVEKLKGGLDEGTIGKWQLFRAVVGDTWKVLADKQPAAVKDLIAALTQETEANTGATDANAEAQKRNAASLAQRMEAAKLAAAEQKKINDLVNQLTGDAAVEKAKQNLAALQQLRHDGAVPLRSEYEGLVKIFGDATKALETQGLKGTQTYRDLKAELDKYKEALKYDELPRGSTLLPSRRIDTMLGAEAMPGFVENMGASVKVFEESQAAAKAWADEVEAGMKAIDAEIQKYYELQGAVIDQAVEGANKAASAYDRWRQSVQNLTIAEQQSAWLSKKPEGMSVTEYATTLGPAFGGKRTSGAPAVNVVVHAENSFLDTPADQMRLAQRMGDAAIQTTRG
jgi:hypothetical protein